MVVYTIFNDHTQWNISDETFYSKLAMIQLASKLTTSSSVNKNEPWTLNSSTGNGEKIRIKNFPRLYVCFLIVDTMEGKERKL